MLGAVPPQVGLKKPGFLLESATVWRDSVCKFSCAHRLTATQRGLPEYGLYRVNDHRQTPTPSGNVRGQLARRHRSPPEFAEQGWMPMESVLQRTPLGRG